MKKLILLVALLLGQVTMAANTEAVGAYGIHLFFSEQEFVDVLTLTRGDEGELVGHMHVPNDFDGSISELKVEGLKITFNLFVPKNSARPQDLVFHYEGEFFDATFTQVKGFVTLEGQADFVASFVGFKRQQAE